MRQILAVIFLTVTVQPALSHQRAALHGVWGTAKQCAGEPIKQGGTVRAAPFEIGEEWLRHGRLWCQLSWFPVEQRATGVFSGAFARCGEDAVRDYLLGMELVGDRLTLRWDVFRANGPLMRCDAP